MKVGILITVIIPTAAFLWALGVAPVSIPPNPGMVFAQEEKPSAPEDESAQEKKEPAAPVKLPGPVSGISPEAFRMIETIEKKNRDLKKREEQIRLREQRLKTLEQNIQQDLKKIEAAIAKSEQQLGIQKDLVKKNVQALVKAYSSMKPQEAARLLEAINEDLALQIISGMKSKVAGKVLSKLDVKVAKQLSEKLAGKRKTPAAR